ncbi:YihY/virulence factor BrkB family protein [Limnofasciculus baicalensis]|uniref:YihY/virulence factor BrkB family protein n=1 Tax=Limnofasciculus baicalensis BBK-W-15 TaxID=2699891 RepID=A0AAE3GSD0_9CYAN|nr:YihY/virulence factor BrkB family protein [Limnofasciculus baicalensis]MCP2729634.1 YihY/virulence factor BrkB family protein [Limnofasciculus baicalensis BBK-W-15]
MLLPRLVRFFRFFRYLNLATVRKTVARAMKCRLMGLSSQMAYNAMLAVFPAILVILTAIELFKQFFPWTNPTVHLRDVAPEEAMQLIHNFAEGIKSSHNQGLFSLSFIVAIWVSSGALGAAMNALDQINQVSPEEIRPFWKAKLISLGLTFGSIFLLFIASSLLVSSHFLVKMVNDKSIVLVLLTFLRLLSSVLALGIVAIVFAVIYRFGSSRRFPETPILPGAVLAAVSWAIVSGIFRYYVAATFGSYHKIYGALGAVIVLQLWLYMSSLVLLLGDQLNFTVGEAMAEARRKTAVIDGSEEGSREWEVGSGEID